VLVRLKEDFRDRSRDRVLLSTFRDYFVLGIERDLYCIYNDAGSLGLFPPALFEILDPTLPPEWDIVPADGGECHAHPPELRRGDFADAVAGVPDALDRVDNYLRRVGLFR
jgi:hypothetical protein